MRAMSKTWDIELTIASSGQEAIELARTQTFDLIFMDIQMPVMDGIEAFQIIQELEGDCPPVHAFTAHTGKSDLDKYQNLGFKSVLTKPMAPKELKSTLKRHIDEQDRGRI
jgi:CheY-like chemotaxis protein